MPSPILHYVVFIFSFFLAASPALVAQSDLVVNGDWIRYTGTGEVYTFTIPADLPDSEFTRLELDVRGADGGFAEVNGEGCMSKGGGGARLMISMPVGEGEFELKPGGTVRFIPALRGKERYGFFTGQGDGGGASGVVYTSITDVAGLSDTETTQRFGNSGYSWFPLAVASGGGGGYRAQSIWCYNSEPGGNAAQPTRHSGNNSNFGTRGGSGYSTDATGDGMGGGGGWKSKGGGDFHGQAGHAHGAYALNVNSSHTFGIGSGGGGTYYGGGGGGGMSGGSAENGHGGKAGNSFICYQATVIDSWGGTKTFSPANGYVAYRLVAYQPPTAKCVPVVELASGLCAEDEIITVADLDAGSYAAGQLDFDLDIVETDNTLAGFHWGTQLRTLRITDEYDRSATCQTLIVIPNQATSSTQLPNDFSTRTIDYSGSAVDYTIPYRTNLTGIRLQLKAGNGGGGELEPAFLCEGIKKDGGKGAFVKADFQVGCSDDRLKQGGELRFIIGGNGSSQSLTAGFCAGTTTGGGGGGSAVLYRGPLDCDWEILMVAGGGGGAQAGGGDNYDGEDGLTGGWTDPGTVGGGGDSNPSNDDRGSNGSGGKNIQDAFDSFYGAAGGGAFGDGENITCSNRSGGRKGGTTGGNGGKASSGCSSVRNGGWGFGGGGAGLDKGGGGGGYTGGNDEGGAGTSYINSNYYYTNAATQRGLNDSGYAKHQLRSGTTVPPTVTCPDNYVVNFTELSEEVVTFLHEIPTVFTAGANCTDEVRITTTDDEFYFTSSCEDLVAPNNIFPLTVKVTNVMGLTATCQTTVTLLDAFAPEVYCATDTVTLGDRGFVSIRASEVATVFDNCGDGTVTNDLSIDLSRFYCDDIGTHVVTVTATDGALNQATCTALVTVLDQDIPVCCAAPMAVCRDVTIGIPTDADSIEIYETGFNTGSSAECGIVNQTVSRSSFTCDDIGDHLVTYTITDEVNRTESCVSTITVAADLCQDFAGELGPDRTITIPNTDLYLNCSGVPIAGDHTITCEDFLNERALSMTTVNDGLTYPFSKLLNFDKDEPLTIEFWLRLTAGQSAGYKHVVSITDGNFHQPIGIYLNGSNAIEVFRYAGTGASSESVIYSGAIPPAGEWTHVAVTILDNFFYLLVNGELVQGERDAAQNSADNTSSGTTQLSIGRAEHFESSPSFLGEMDELRIHAKGLLDYQIEENMHAGARTDEGNLVYYTNFDAINAEGLPYDYTENNLLPSSFDGAYVTDDLPVIAAKMVYQVYDAGACESVIRVFTDKTECDPLINPPAVSDFSASHDYACVGDVVALTDLSSSWTTEWEWTISPADYVFANGTDAESQHPELSFTEGGAYTISLRAGNTIGFADARVRKVVIIDDEAVPFYEDFSGGVIPNELIIVNSDDHQTWGINTPSADIDGNPGNYVIRMHNYDYNAPGEEDIIVLPSLDLTLLTDPSLVFDLSYAAYDVAPDSNPDDNTYERLRVEYSTDCGATFQPAGYDKENMELATTPFEQAGVWTPTSANHWRREIVDLSAFQSENVILRIVQTNNYANDLYLDNIQVTGLSSLPVEFLSFSGRTMSKTNVLNWAVTSESDFSHYALERSASGNNDWAVMAEVPGADAGAVSVGDGAPNVSRQRSYESVDFAPLNQAYYRLRSVDLDGSFSLSHVVYLERDAAATLRVFPNPTTGDIAVSLPTEEPTTLQVLDLNGKVLRTTVVTGGRYDDRLDLPSGVYLMLATSAGERWTERVVVR